MDRKMFDQISEHLDKLINANNQLHSRLDSEQRTAQTNMENGRTTADNVYQNTEQGAQITEAEARYSLQIAKHNRLSLLNNIERSYTAANARIQEHNLQLPQLPDSIEQPALSTIAPSVALQNALAKAQESGKDLDKRIEALYQFQAALQARRRQTVQLVIIGATIIFVVLLIIAALISSGLQHQKAANDFTATNLAMSTAARIAEIGTATRVVMLQTVSKQNALGTDAFVNLQLTEVVYYNATIAQARAITTATQEALIQSQIRSTITAVPTINQQVISASVPPLINNISGKWQWVQDPWNGFFYVSVVGTTFSGTLDDIYEGTYGDKITNGTIVGSAISFVREGQYGKQYWKGMLALVGNTLTITNGQWRKDGQTSWSSFQATKMG